MRRVVFFSVILIFFQACKEEEKPAPVFWDVLIFSKTEGFRHPSIPDGIAAISGILDELGVSYLATEEAGELINGLDSARLVIFVNTTGDILDVNEQTQFEAWYGADKGFIGIHSATDTEYNWPFYNQLVGAYFDSHPQQQEATLNVEDAMHVSTVDLPTTWSIFEEWYNLRQVRPAIQVLLTVDESTYEGGTMGANHPISWYSEELTGRSWYTAMGHRSETYLDANFKKHLEGGIRYALYLD